VNAASELPDTPLPNDREVAYYKVDVEDRPSADLLSHMDFVADMIEEVSSGALSSVVSSEISTHHLRPGLVSAEKESYHFFFHNGDVYEQQLKRSVEQISNRE
jgi:hypothetical protein